MFNRQQFKNNYMLSGILLILAGIGVIGFGLIYNKNKPNDNENLSLLDNKIDKEINIGKTEKVEIHNDFVQKNDDNKPSAVKENDADFIEKIKLATADGVLSQSEIQFLENKAQSLNLNFDNYKTLIENLLEENKHQKEVAVIDKNKEKGDDFEKFIVQKFSKQYFSILEWAGDKYVEGNFAKTTIQPDLKMRFSLNKSANDFAIECKYRSNLYKNGIEWCSEKQLNNYKAYENNNNIPVFVAIGLGGTALMPESLFIIPLRNIDNTFLNIDFLKKYQKNNLSNNLFYDIEKKVLK